jgi:LEA14-like dessication related protein
MVALLSSCAAIKPIFETPSVTISSFRSLPASGVNPQFEIGLHIVNPNGIALNLKGMSYTALIGGHRVLVGANNALPSVAAYGEQDITVQATADLLAGIQLLGSLVSQPRKQLSYQLQVKLDVGDFIPLITVEQLGEIQLSR